MDVWHDNLGDDEPTLDLTGDVPDFDSEPPPVVIPLDADEQAWLATWAEVLP